MFTLQSGTYDFSVKAKSKVEALRLFFASITDYQSLGKVIFVEHGKDVSFVCTETARINYGSCRPKMRIINEKVMASSAKH